MGNREIGTRPIFKICIYKTGSRNETGSRKIKESITNLTANYFHQNFSFTRSVVKVN